MSKCRSRFSCRRIRRARRRKGKKWKFNNTLWLVINTGKRFAKNFGKISDGKRVLTRGEKKVVASCQRWIFSTIPLKRPTSPCFFLLWSFFLSRMSTFFSISIRLHDTVSLWPSSSLSSFFSSSFHPFYFHPSLIPPGIKDLVCEFWGPIKCLRYLRYLTSKRGLRDFSPFSNLGRRICVSYSSFSYVKSVIRIFLSSLFFLKFRYLVKDHCNWDFEI